jgi:hypothetical protein
MPPDGRWLSPVFGDAEYRSKPVATILSEQELTDRWSRLLLVGNDYVSKHVPKGCWRS